MTDPVDFIPAGCCCDSKDWLGKKLERGPVLTDAFIKSAAAQGSIVPPHTGLDVRANRVLGTLGLFLVIGALAAALVIYGTRV